MAQSLRSLKDLRALRQRIASLPDVRVRIAKRVAGEFSKLAKKDFDAQRSPDGKAWPPAKRTGKKVTLHKSGMLEHAATTFTAIGTRIRASALSVRWARFQLRRQFMPRVLPKEWAERTREIANEEIDLHMRGAR